MFRNWGIFISFGILLALTSKCNSQNINKISVEDCTECRMQIVESIPEGLTFDEDLKHMTTYESWKHLISLAEKSIEIGSYYWTMQGHEYDHPTANQGKEIFKLLKEKGIGNGVNISIVVDETSDTFKNEDIKELVDAEAAIVRTINFTKVLEAGVLHTKMLVVDRKHLYIGSANFDWRALTQVKELGVLVTNCSCIGNDLGKAFDVYWKIGDEDFQIPEKWEWEEEYESEFNHTNPFQGSYNAIPYSSYISSAPPQFCPKGRTGDLDAIFDVIDNAEEFIHIAVMDYFPMILFQKQPSFWPDIDNRLRAAAIDRRVKVKLLMAKWSNTKTNWYYFLNSLENLHKSYAWVDIQVQMFEVPSTDDQNKIPFARVNHNKYMVTDKSAYIGTSNWSGDYFTSSAGIAMIVSPKNRQSDDIRQQVENIFSRDWNSTFSHRVSTYFENENCSNKGSRPLIISPAYMTSTIIVSIVCLYVM